MKYPFLGRRGLRNIGFGTFLWGAFWTQFRYARSDSEE